ncbi:MULTISPECIES: triphosphoribosyl-dephospho-CoA synthase [unclassified Methanosarcina]|uniref:triphosphoribosyl-dephospho-CoA synthase n=1 Tax=unclassified Methanosarcina TaxID=2644672 RepID=UPI00061607F8|nr:MULTISPECIES: triphosphoribosyl-dephospho-CoA synthase [unclassified Methanosarcina]AKB17318.1 Triphosphoribosyl-dephospho-CoA synthetase [Methanosarcina sp. WWM596]AKB20715.1 Triphosphoribosyl-dephospho-CoA synthetase [Methanosarcina sp. WH1]
MKPNNSAFSLHIPEWVEESRTPSLIARCAQLAMLLEVSASPKPGNVDREHNYPDTCFEHFIASSVAAYPVLELAARSRDGIGILLRSAVYESSAWQQGGNTHFGAFLLLIPLAMAAGEISGEPPHRGKAGFRLEAGDFEGLAARAHAFVRATNCEDAVEFYRAFGHAGVRVNSVDEFDLEDPEATADLRKQNITLYDLMEIARGYDLIADEWTSGFGRCLEGAKSILEFMQVRNCEAEAFTGGSVSTCSGTGINEAIVYTFLKLLSRHRDTFIQTKFDTETADYVSSRAGKILSGWEASGKTARDFTFILPSVQDFDSELLEKRINPGSTADIIIAGLFISFLGGLRF